MSSTSTTGNVGSINLKTVTCRGVVVKEFNKGVTVETLQVEPPQAKEVRIKMVAVGLCHTDILWMQGKVPDQALPFVLGHEGAGVVESIGEGVQSLKPGDKVLTIFMAQCRKCNTCLGNKSNFCEESWGRPSGNSLSRHFGYNGKPRFYLNGEPVYHMAGASSFCEYVVAPENSCVKVNIKAPLNKVCVLACGFSTGYGTATNSIQLLPSDKVAVFGLGGVGLAAVFGCKEKGAKQIIGVDILNEKEHIARKMGITDFINARDTSNPVEEVIREKTKGGVDYAIVCVGDSKAMETAVLSTNIGGTMVIVGFGDHKDFQVNPTFLFFSRKIKGSIIGGQKYRYYNILDDIPKLVDKYLDGKLPLDDFITHQLKLDQINEGIELLEHGKSIRSVFNM